MRRIICFVLFLCLLTTAASAQMSFAGSTSPELKWERAPGLVCPGADQQFVCLVPPGQTAAVSVTDIAGTELQQLLTDWTGGAFLWDGWGLEGGTYTLLAETEDQRAETSVTVGAPVTGLKVLASSPAARTVWTARVRASLPGMLTAETEDGTQIFRQDVEAGETDLAWDAAGLAQGEHTITLTLTTEEDTANVTVPFTLAAPSLATDTEYYTPAEMTGVSCPHEQCYWNMNMGELDEEAIWRELTAPMTVLTGHERNQIRIRKEPRSDCKQYTGTVTGQSQAVHVLERGEEWSLIQAYSSSVEGSSVPVFAKPFTGYVETALLRERNVSQHIGLVIDKLQQRLYVFMDGHLYSTLLCSTGFSKSDTPFNETPAGEFVCQSWTGGFWSGSLWCDWGIRINDGILLHEVPVLITKNADGSETRDEQRCEQYLGEKASHGCIRIQRKPSPEGVNMRWLWDHLSRGDSAPSKVIIWDEVGRTLGYPDDGVTLYYNPNKGSNYHAKATCEGVRSNYLPLKPFLYGQLNEKPYSKLTPCPYCAPQLTHKGVDTANKKNNRSY